MSLLRRIAKHASIIILPEALFLCPFAVMTGISGSALVHAMFGERAVQVVFGGLAVAYALFLSYYYFKLIEEKCRANRQVACIEMQPAMRYVDEQFPHQALPGQVLPTNGLQISEEREIEILEGIIDDLFDFSEVSKDSEDAE